MTLVLHSELPGVLEVSRTHAGRLAQLPDFPEPDQHTEGGVELWAKEDLERWKRARTVRVGRPPKTEDQYLVDGRRNLWAARDALTRIGVRYREEQWQPGVWAIYVPSHADVSRVFGGNGQRPTEGGSEWQIRK